MGADVLDARLPDIANAKASVLALGPIITEEGLNDEAVWLGS